MNNIPLYDVGDFVKIKTIRGFFTYNLEGAGKYVYSEDTFDTSWSPCVVPNAVSMSYDALMD